MSNTVELIFHLHIFFHENMYLFTYFTHYFGRFCCLFTIQISEFSAYKSFITYIQTISPTLDYLIILLTVFFKGQKLLILMNLSYAICFFYGSHFWWPEKFLHNPRIFFFLEVLYFYALCLDLWSISSWFLYGIRYIIEGFFPNEYPIFPATFVEKNYSFYPGLPLSKISCPYTYESFS